MGPAWCHEGNWHLYQFRGSAHSHSVGGLTSCCLALVPFQNITQCSSGNVNPGRLQTEGYLHCTGLHRQEVQPDLKLSLETHGPFGISSTQSGPLDENYSHTKAYTSTLKTSGARTRCSWPMHRWLMALWKEAFPLPMTSQIPHHFKQKKWKSALHSHAVSLRELDCFLNQSKETGPNHSATKSHLNVKNGKEFPLPCCTVFIVPCFQSVVWKGQVTRCCTA